MNTKLKYDEVIVTPEMAKELLDKHANKNNRSINRANVLMYARVMREGNWTLDGEAIIFDSNNMMLNGHHRMYAVIEAGVPVEFTFTHNVATECFKNIDNGRSRTAGDIFKMKTIENFTNVSSIVRRFNQLNLGCNIITSDGHKSGISNSNSGKKLTNAETLELYEQHPLDFQEFCCYAQCLRNFRNYFKISDIGAVMCYLHLTLGYKKESIYTFFNMLYQYKTEDDYELCKCVREIILKAALKGYKLSGVYKQAILATAWNNYIAGNKRKKLMVSMTTKPIEFQ